jgi:integrase
MAKLLTVAAVQRLRPTRERREVRDAGAPGLHLVIQPSGIKSWAVRLRRPDGRPAKLTLGRCVTGDAETDDEPVLGGALTLRQARELANRVDRQRAMGHDVASLTQQRRKEQRLRSAAEGRDFASVARDFVEDHCQRRNRGWKVTAKTLGLDYRDTVPTIIAGGLCERWAAIPAAEIDSHAIFAVVDEARRHAIPGRRASTTGTSDSRGRVMANTIGKLFAWAAQHRRVATNPAVGMHRPSSPPSRHRVLSTTELRWLWLALDEIGMPFAPVIKLLMLTGARRSEVAGMEWAELSDDFSVWSLPAARSKNKLPNTVFLPPMARAIVEGVARIAQSRFIFTTTGTTPINGFSKVKLKLDGIMLKIAQEEAGRDPDLVSIPEWRIHDIRRSVVTHMAEIGVLPHVIEEVVNHVSGHKGGVAGVYNKAAYAAEKKAALERWALHLAGVVENAPANVVSMALTTVKRRGRR